MKLSMYIDLGAVLTTAAGLNKMMGEIIEHVQREVQIKNTSATHTPVHHLSVHTYEGASLKRERENTRDPPPLPISLLSREHTSNPIKGALDKRTHRKRIRQKGKARHITHDT